MYVYVTEFITVTNISYQNITIGLGWIYVVCLLGESPITPEKIVNSKLRMGVL